MVARTITEKEFYEKCIIDPFTGCWNWATCKNPKDYGKLGYKNAYWQAHRLSWVFANKKDIPKGMLVCHSCDNPPCINPDHLFLGTNQDNSQDMSKKGRAGKRLKKLTDSQVLKIRERGGTETKSSLSREFKVSWMTIYNIIHRKVWRNI